MEVGRMDVLWQMVAALLSGCMAFTLGLGAQEESSLLDLWKAYFHCRESHDLDHMLVDSRRLQQGVRLMTAQ